MNTKTNTHHIEVQGLSIEVVRKDIKNFYIGVHPPNGRIRVSAPLQLDDDAIRMAIISRLRWIRRQQAAFEKQERQSQREFVTGESHYFQGKRYRLDVLEQDCPPKVWLPNNTRSQLVSVRDLIETRGRQFSIVGIASSSVRSSHRCLRSGNRNSACPLMRCGLRR